MSDASKFSAEFEKGNSKLKVLLNVFIWYEKSIYYAFSPALDITGYGKTEREAKESFEITLNEFVKYTTNKNTLFDALEQLGWTVNRKRNRMHVPNIADLLNDNKSFREMYKRKEYKVEKRGVELALD